MLGLPDGTVINKQLSKKSIYEKFNLTSVARNNFDADIRKLTITNEVSGETTNIKRGEGVSSFFVVTIVLKKEKYDEKNIITISKLINQKMFFVLEFQGKARLAVYHKKLIQSDWQLTESLEVTLKGLNLDTVWENIIVDIGGFQIECGNTLEDQIEVDAEKIKIEKQINKLERQARTEKQPKKKFELVQELNKLKRELC